MMVGLGGVFVVWGRGRGYWSDVCQFPNAKMCIVIKCRWPNVSCFFVRVSVSSSLANAVNVYFFFFIQQRSVILSGFFMLCDKW